MVEPGGYGLLGGKRKPCDDAAVVIIFSADWESCKMFWRSPQ